MKNPFFLGWLISFVFLSNVYSQDSLAYKSRFQFRISGGMNIPLSDLNQNRETDFLINLENKVGVPVSLTFTFFLKKHWGIEADLKINNSTGNEQKFKENITQQYENNFFPSIGTGISNETPKTGTIGIVYRKETEKFYFHPKLAIGIISFETNWGRARLKERNTNIEYELTYSAGKVYQDYFCVLPSFSTGYKMSKRFWIDLETSIVFYKTNFTYEKNLLNLYTQQNQKENIEYKKNRFETNISLGLKYVF